jgi:hypothetical protein
MITFNVMPAFNILFVSMTFEMSGYKGKVKDIMAAYVITTEMKTMLQEC